MNVIQTDNYANAGTPQRRTPSRSQTSTPQRSTGSSPTNVSSNTRQSNSRKAPQLCSYFKAGYLRFTRRNIICIIVASIILIGILILVNNKSFSENLFGHLNAAYEKIIQTYAIKKSN